MFGFAQVDIEVTDELYDKFSEMSPLFVVQEIPDQYIPEEMKIYGKSFKKNSEEHKKIAGCYESKKDSFVHAPN